MKESPATARILPSYQPPPDSARLLVGGWVPVAPDDPVVLCLQRHLTLPATPTSWAAARLSRAVFAYREQCTGASASVKFYHLKTDQAERYARQEHEAIAAAQEAGLRQGPLAAIPALGLCGPLLVLEYVEGLTLEDAIAIRRSRPGSLLTALEHVAALLAVLHANSAEPEAPRRFEAAISYVEKTLKNLSQHGVLQSEPLIRDGLRRRLSSWASRPAMSAYLPCRIHGDATTSNFIYPSGTEGIVALDWERSKLDDPASDLGRLLAEIDHTLSEHGASPEEAHAALEHLGQAYLQRYADATLDDPGDLMERVRFYRALSSLRIARNGWLPRPVRMALVARSLALLV